MRHWDDDSRAEFELAVENAWNSGANDRDRTEAFIAALQDAEQAQRGWAVEVLAAALRDGAWKRLKDNRKALEPMFVAFADSEHAMPRIGGVARRNDETGAVEYRQLAFIDMTIDELRAKQQEHDNTIFAARRNKYMLARLIELIESADGATTGREAALIRRLDVDSYLAVEAS